jgi:cob(I)alamin adenosyltransferase
MGVKKGYIHVYTGDGKGKTTASLGLAMRAVGANKRVGIVFFDKAGDFYSERKIFDRQFFDQIDYWVCGRKRFDPKSDRFDMSIIEEDQFEARRGMEIAGDIMNRGEHDLLILDEINSVLHQGLVDLVPVLELLSQKPSAMELVLTGRNAKQDIMEAADLVTDMRSIKHYMEQGVLARQGIEY